MDQTRAQPAKIVVSSPTLGGDETTKTGKGPDNFPDKIHTPEADNFPDKNSRWP
jgi:hypothetical protein